MDSYYKPRLYRKKPVAVEAFQYKGYNMQHILQWANENAKPERSILGSPGAIYVKTLEGTMKMEIGDYLIRGVNGEFYPCKQEIFHKTYELEPGQEV